MRLLLVCPDDFLFRLLRGAASPGEAATYIVEDPAVRARITRRGLPALAGDLEDPALYLASHGAAQSVVAGQDLISELYGAGEATLLYDARPCAA